MLYTGVDYHRRYSVAVTLDATGARVREARIDGNEPAAFAAYFGSLPATSAVVMEEPSRRSPAEGSPAEGVKLCTLHLRAQAAPASAEAWPGS